jgi:hypothetical protein
MSMTTADLISNIDAMIKTGNPIGSDIVQELRDHTSIFVLRFPDKHFLTAGEVALSRRMLRQILDCRARVFSHNKAKGE